MILAVDIRALTAAEVPPYAPALLRLQRAAYAVEAALLGDDRIPALHEDQEDLVDAHLDWLLEVDDGDVAAHWAIGSWTAFSTLIG